MMWLEQSPAGMKFNSKKEEPNPQTKFPGPGDYTPTTHDSMRNSKISYDTKMDE